MPNLGPFELLLILAVVLVLFGVGRIGKLGGELGKGIKAFREGVREAKDDTGEAGEEAESQA